MALVDRKVGELWNKVYQTSPELMADWVKCFGSSYYEKEQKSKQEIKNSLTNREYQTDPGKNFLLRLMSCDPSLHGFSARTLHVSAYSSLRRARQLPADGRPAHRRIPSEFRQRSLTDGRSLQSAPRLAVYDFRTFSVDVADRNGDNFTRMALAAFNTMTAIKKKMHNMKEYKESAFDRADQLEQKLIEHKAISEKHGEEIIVLQKRINQIQTDLVTAQTQCQEASDKLEETNKQLAAMESEVVSMTKRVRLLEEDYDGTETKLQQTSTKLDEATKAADESERGRKVLEVRTLTDEERIQQLENELEVTILFGEEADRKYEETARKLAVTEVDLERSLSQVENAESKIIELEEELKVVSNNMKSLEIAEQEAAMRQETYETMVQSLTDRLKDAELRATEAERSVTKLQKEVDRLEDELGIERDKFRLVATELDSTFTELAGF